MSRDEKRPRRPTPLGNLIPDVLKAAGVSERVEQAAIIPEWPRLVGAGIAAATEPLYVSGDGTLFVAVKTNAWMTELSLLEPELLKALNRQAEGRPKIVKIRWQLKR